MTPKKPCAAALVAAIMERCGALGLSGVDAAVLVALWTFADRGGHAFPSQATLAKRACVSERTARAALERLEAKGLVRSQVRRDVRERHALEYWLTPTEPEESAGSMLPTNRKNLPVRPEESAGSNRKNLPEKYPSEVTKEVPTPNPPDARVARGGGEEFQPQLGIPSNEPPKPAALTPLAAVQLAAETSNGRLPSPSALRKEHVPGIAALLAVDARPDTWREFGRVIDEDRWAKEQGHVGVAFVVSDAGRERFDLARSRLAAKPRRSPYDTGAVERIKRQRAEAIAAREARVPADPEITDADRAAMRDGARQVLAMIRGAHPRPA